MRQKTSRLRDITDYYIRYPGDMLKKYHTFEVANAAEYSFSRNRSPNDYDSSSNNRAIPARGEVPSFFF